METFDYSILTGKVITRDSENYNEHILSWNRAIDKKPHTIIYCYNEKDVINAIKWAVERDIEIRVRSGGHNYEGYSTGDNVAVIDVSNINDIKIKDEGIVKIGGGVRNREAYEALGSKGYAFPGGGCPTVGVAGLILGGGWGYSSRYLGLASDSLIEVEIINFKGEKIVANKKENKDLFWALMGSGGCNFGIITSMTLKLSVKAEKASIVYINYPNSSNEVITNFILKLQDLYKDLDRRVNLKTAIYNSVEAGKGVKATGIFYGTEEEVNKVLKPLLEIDENIEVIIEEKDLLLCNRWIQDSHPDYEKYKSTGRFVYKDYNKEDIKRFIDIVSSPANGYYYNAISFYGLGGAIADVNKDSTAFYYRDAKFILGIQSVWEEDKFAEVNRKWVIDNFKTIKEMTVGSFVNFPFNELDEFEKEYYGNNYKKLREIKEKYNPNNVFNFPQAIKYNIKE